ncbi:MAG: lactonase family protein [Luteitalea sp.]
MTRQLAIVACGLALIALALRPVFAQTRSGAAAGETLVYIGTYTGAKSEGIYLSRLDLTSGALAAPVLAAKAANPSFLAIHPKGTFLFAVNEVATFAGQPTGAVSAFSIDRRTGQLGPLNQQSSGGNGPAHLTVDPSGRNVLVANYGGGTVAVLPVGADGRLQQPSSVIQHTGSSVDPKRQTKPYAHSINLEAGGHFAYAADLGTDKLTIYRFDAAAGTLTAGTPASVALSPGSGPRHLAIHPNGRFVYVINEMRLDVAAFGQDAARGVLTPLQTISSLPPGLAVASGFSGAEIQVHPSGRFVYTSNRGHDSITAFAVDASSGRLSFVANEPTQGAFPRGFGIDPTGQFLIAANQRSDSLVVFRIDQASGRLTAAGHAITVGAPVCVKFVARQ